MVTRRWVLAGAMALAWPRRARASGLSAADLGILPDPDTDQSAAFQAALNQAAAEGRALFLPPGPYRAGGLELPQGTALSGHAGSSVIRQAGSAPILTGQGLTRPRIDGVAFQGHGGADTALPGLIELSDCQDIRIEDCLFNDASARSIDLFRSGGIIRACRIAQGYGAAIAARDATGLWVRDNTISDCANLGVYLERGQAGHDGTIVTGNRISRIGWAEGGNGQNGNAINAFRTGGVVIQANVISDCAFSAVRLNATTNAIVRANNCRNLDEVAIFSEFEFSGSIIADNIIDGAAHGIAITNLDTGGRLATCSGNIVRNIRAASPTNPDTFAVGISAEADTIVSANLVEMVPGQGIALGWGPYMRDVSALGNTVRAADIGISVSVVEGTGVAQIADNMLSGCRLGLAGMAWNEVTVPDLRAARDEHPNLLLSDNAVIGAP